MERDGSGNFSAGTVSVSGLNDSGLTASQAVVTDSSKNLASLGYGSTNSASTLVERDGSGNFSAGNITANSSLIVDGSSSGAITIQGQSASGTYNFNLPTTAGTSGYCLTSAGGGASAMTWTPVASAFSGLTTNGIMYASSGTTLASTSAGSQYQSMIANGSGAPSFQVLNLGQSAAVTGTLPNSNTTATSSNTPSTIVARDGSGNFTAGTVTAALTGTASGNTTYTANNHGVVVSGSGNAMTVIAPDASTSKLLISGGASADPSWSLITNSIFEWFSSDHKR